MRDGLLLLVVIFALVATLRYPFVGILTWAWFSLMTPHQLAYGVYGLPLNVLIAGATIFSLVASGSFARFSFDRITALLLLLAMWLTVSQMFSLDPQNSGQYYDRYVKTLVFVVLCVQTARDKLRFHALLWILVVGIGYFGFKGALFTVATLGQYRVQGIDNTVLSDNNHLGTALATILPMILYLRSVASNPLVKTGLFGLFIATILAIIGTHSRGAFIALIVFGGFFWMRSKHKVSILAALALVLVPAIAFMPSKWTERMESIADAKDDASFMGRVDAWFINTELALKYPLTGAGLRNSYQKEIAATVDIERSKRAKAAHSIYFEMLGGSGFVGLAIYLSLLATAFFSALSLHLRRNDPAIEPWIPQFGYFAQMSLVVFGVGGAAVSLEMWDGYFIIIALIAAALKLSNAKAPAATTVKVAHQRGPSWRFAARGRS
ncbi:MAG TPA: putative O-glycosylation ligase, exosortase A system-associated [Parvularculaceae bacterium]|nr:putative O-glycosylation ligase, exosortase A system-associated [Caulobacterales bacterium]HPE31124.1 putative O-glycosylation ligase, exosortase A system-associated [Parvularculaceae bacterium]HRX38465.1 putative O-glycosylation ligase, exosortase A system-associated [Parvularculaceae bacterium]